MGTNRHGLFDICEPNVGITDEKGPPYLHARSAAALMSLRAEEGGYMRQRLRAAGNKN
jgi:hypothetical protein